MNNANAVTKGESEGSRIYNRAFLSIYDLYVIKISNSLIWRCPSRVMLAMYNANVTSNHLDIGPGSGWYLRETSFPTDNPAVTLLDLNPNSLAKTTARLHGRGIEAASHTGSILAPIETGAAGSYTSASANFLMHCVPGTWAEKGIAFRHVADALADDGVFFGSTILARGVRRTPAARLVNATYNNVVRSLHNADDDPGGLREQLDAAFGDVDLTFTGAVATWVARAPRRSADEQPR